MTAGAVIVVAHARHVVKAVNAASSVAARVAMARRVAVHPVTIEVVRVVTTDGMIAANSPNVASRRRRCRKSRSCWCQMKRASNPWLGR